MPSRTPTRRARAALLLLLLTLTSTATYLHYSTAEPCYLGYPATWWARRLSILPMRGPVVPPPPTLTERWWRGALAFVGRQPPDEPPGYAVLDGEHREAVPVLVVLVLDPDPCVRYWAAEGLRCVRPPAKEAVPALVEAVRRYGGKAGSRRRSAGGEGLDVLRDVVMEIDGAAAATEVRMALEAIDPEAARRAGVGDGKR
jgi:hypothetical protein